MQLIFYAILIGAGATIFMDVYAVIVKKLFNIPSLDYRLVGRWIGNFKNGIFSHQNIMQTKPIPHERLIGWMAHYGIGIGFAFVLLFIWGVNWLEHPSLFPAILIGISTTLAPFFMMQPAFGFGIAASKTPNPRIARIRSLWVHFIYGIGLYVSALLVNVVLI
ncbi:DUF2938 domain-containing protein [Elizabethkingia ursingii]|uniref:DUF2938 domain-containing protein n=1 Tax=Elizabethkingia ursingii TaxID=1756150 RepID=UPI002012727C|nr:DUF2938 domain-containing protein [Elizabethkingia ursingii]MCL1665914.1 DUF2938 domain-containing protein [Elizabethkingia ursingii]